MCLPRVNIRSTAGEGQCWGLWRVDTPDTSGNSRSCGGGVPLGPLVLILTETNQKLIKAFFHGRNKLYMSVSPLRNCKGIASVRE